MSARRPREPHRPAVVRPERLRPSQAALDRELRRRRLLDITGERSVEGSVDEPRLRSGRRAIQRRSRRRRRRRCLGDRVHGLRTRDLHRHENGDDSDSRHRGGAPTEPPGRRAHVDPRRGRSPAPPPPPPGRRPAGSRHSVRPRTHPPRAVLELFEPQEGLRIPVDVGIRPVGATAQSCELPDLVVHDSTLCPRRLSRAAGGPVSAWLRRRSADPRSPGLPHRCRAPIPRLARARRR